MLAESVTFANAVQQEQFHLPQQRQRHHHKMKKKNLVRTLHKRYPSILLASSDTTVMDSMHHRHYQQQQQENTAGNDDEAFSYHVPLPSCLGACAHCLDPIHRSSCTYDDMTSMRIPRGGHMTTPVSSVADAVLDASSSSQTTPYNIPLRVWKVIFQAILTALNVVCWLLPLKSKKISENKLAMSLANAFSGGVFLSLAFGHLIPECAHGFQDSGSKWPAETPYLLVLAGYLLIFFVEKVAFDAHEIMHEMSEGPGHHHHHRGHGQNENGRASNAKADSVTLASGSGSRGAIILLGALAVHSVLEMMALGLADSFGDCALLTVSIALHQPAESIALLVALLKSGMPEAQVIKYLSVFSCMGPIGVALGMAVNEYAAPIVDVLMLAVVAGTFVYVGATEVIPEEWEDGQHRWAKFAALGSGIVSILVITQYTMSLSGHSH